MSPIVLRGNAFAPLLLQFLKSKSGESLPHSEDGRC